MNCLFLSFQAFGQGFSGIITVLPLVCRLGVIAWGLGAGFYFVFSELLTPSILCNYCGKLAFLPRATDACATRRISQAQPTDDATQSCRDMVPTSFHLLFCSEGKRGVGPVSLHAGGGLEFSVLPSGEISSDATAEFILVFKKLEF